MGKNSDFWAQQADQAAREASDAASRAAACRDRLTSGASNDPEADRYFLRRHEEDQRVAEANTRDFRQNARRRWF